MLPNRELALYLFSILEPGEPTAFVLVNWRPRIPQNAGRRRLFMSAALFLFETGLNFDHLNNTSGFGIDPSDGRSGAKRPIQLAVAHLPNFPHTLHRLS